MKLQEIFQSNKPKKKIEPKFEKPSDALEKEAEMIARAKKNMSKYKNLFKRLEDA